VKKLIFALLFFSHLAGASFVIPNGAVTPPKLAFGSYNLMSNCSFSASASAGVLTIALKTLDGSALTALSPCRIGFRSATAATGSFSELTASSATTLTLSSGSTLGAVNDVPFRLWLVAVNDGGTLRLGVINTLSSSLEIFPVNDHDLISSTSEGGGGGADLVQTYYTQGGAVTTKAMRILGWLEWGSGLSAIGTWVVPTKVSLFGPGMPRPGDIIQTRRNSSSSSATGTTTIPLDDTIPTSSEGTQFFTQAITPTSSANLLRIQTKIHYSTSTGGAHGIEALFQDSGGSAIAVNGTRADSAVMGTSNMDYLMLASTTSSTTFKVRMGGNTATTVTVNGSSGSRKYGGTSNSWMGVTEIMR